MTQVDTAKHKMTSNVYIKMEVWALVRAGLDPPCSASHGSALASENSTCSVRHIEQSRLNTHYPSKLFERIEHSPSLTVAVK